MFGRRSRAARRRRTVTPPVAGEVSTLEPRILPAANLQLTEVYLVNGRGVRIAAPVAGETIRVHVRWVTFGMDSGQASTLRVTVNGVPLDAPVQSQSGEAVQGDWTRWGWFASAGQTRVLVQLDAHNAVAESNELDNIRRFRFSALPPAAIPQKFVWPVSGTRGRDWSITAYADHDPRPDRWSDYTGGAVTYDGHNAVDIGIGNFAAMDRGVSVLAAAGGTIETVVDGFTDRNLLPLSVPNPPPANWVRINHGQGWVTEYWHLAAGSVRFRPGDQIARGQVLAEVGSSGHSNGAHLHFVVKYNDSVVDPQVAPAAYFERPLGFQGMVAPTAMDSGITNDWFRNASGQWPDMNERPSDIRVFSTREQKPVHFWSLMSHTRTGDRFDARWYGPDGNPAFEESAISQQYSTMESWLFILPSSLAAEKPGIWRVTLHVNDRAAAQQLFRVTSWPAPQEIRVRFGDTLLPVRRRTPVDFGSVRQGSSEVRRTFAIENHGGSELQLQQLSLPGGFRLSGSFPARILPGRTTRITILMSTASAGRQTGEVQFRTNDADESLFVFLITGTVR